jgi:hypothetical protein
LLCQQLLTKDYQTRLGNGSAGAEAVKAHPWFHSIDWEAIASKETTSPFLPLFPDPNPYDGIDPEFLNPIPMSNNNG